MKGIVKLLVLIALVVMINSCFAKEYYEPAISHAFPNNTIIPAEGGDYYFYVGYDLVQTKFQPPRAFKPIRFRVDIGDQTGEVYVFESDAAICGSWPYWLERPEEYDHYYPVYFNVPANDTASDRAVKLMVSVDRNYSDAKKHDWESWNQVWKGLQNCKK